MSVPIYVTLLLIPKPIEANQALQLNVAIAIPTTTSPGDNGAPEWLKALAKEGDAGKTIMVGIMSGLTALINAFEGLTVSAADAKSTATQAFSTFLQGDTKDKLITGLETQGVPIGEAVAKKALSALVTGLFTAAASELIGGSTSTEIWVGLQITCQGVSALKQCFPGTVVPDNKEVDYLVGLTVALAKVHAFSFAGNSFKILTGQNLDFEYQFAKRSGAVVLEAGAEIKK